MCFLFFFFNQKTAYEMRIRDWSSDVCSSDLGEAPGQRTVGALDGEQAIGGSLGCRQKARRAGQAVRLHHATQEIAEGVRQRPGGVAEAAVGDPAVRTLPAERPVDLAQPRLAVALARHQAFRLAEAPGPRPEKSVV